MEGREVVGVGIWLQDNTRLVSGFGLGGGRHEVSLGPGFGSCWGYLFLLISLGASSP